MRPTRPFSADKLEQLLEVSQNTFAHTIVDLPPTMTEDLVAGDRLATTASPS